MHERGYLRARPRRLFAELPGEAIASFLGAQPQGSERQKKDGESSRNAPWRTRCGGNGAMRAGMPCNSYAQSRRSGRPRRQLPCNYCGIHYWQKRMKLRAGVVESDAQERLEEAGPVTHM
eukprot:3941408-Pyramimonas_sp.AAC.1